MFVPKPPKRYESELDEQIFSQLSLTSFVAVPLVVQNEVIGMAYFTSYQKPMEVTREVIRRISGFCDQIAGAIQNSLLLQITEEERKNPKEPRQKFRR